MKYMFQSYIVYFLSFYPSLFFLQLSCAWQQVPWLQQALSSALSSSSSLLQNRHNILQAVAQLQVKKRIMYTDRSLYMVFSSIKHLAKMKRQHFL